MNVSPLTRFANTFKTTSNIAALSVCAENFKYFAYKGLELASDPASRLSEIKDTVSSIWTSSKDFFKSIEPYQPWAAGAMIIGKALWKTTTKSQIQKDIKAKKNKLLILKHLHNSKVKDFSQKITALEGDVRSKQDDLTLSALSVAQLGSLFFSHPGSNIWNGMNTLYGRLFSLRNTKLTNAPATMALGVISALGTATSLLRITGAITGDEPLSHLIIGTSFVGMAIESSLMIKNWLFR